MEGKELLCMRRDLVEKFALVIETCFSFMFLLLLPLLLLLLMTFICFCECVSFSVFFFDWSCFLFHFSGFVI